MYVQYTSSILCRYTFLKLPLPVSWSNCGHLFKFRTKYFRIHDHLFNRIIRDETFTFPRVRRHINLLGTTCCVPWRKDPLERLPKFRVENRIDDRIEGGIRVTEPRQHLEGLITDARFTEGGQNVHAKERHPADKKHAHYYADRNGRFVVGLMEITDFRFVRVRFGAP